MKHYTQFTISKKPGPMALVVETSSFTIIAKGASWEAEEDVDYTDSVINVYISFRGQQGQEYEMKMKLNGHTEDLKGTLYTNGINKITPSFSLDTFFKAPPRVLASSAK